MSSELYSGVIALELNIASGFVRNVLKLLEEGATIPFIARYRKEMTGSMDETVITEIRDRVRKLKDLDARRDSILKSLQEQDKLTPELEQAVHAASSLSELEDIYLPYKPKRKTRATLAKEKGLEPLAEIILSQKYDDIPQRSLSFVNPEKGVENTDGAIKGACDIIAEWVNENSTGRKGIRRIYIQEGLLASHIIKGKEQEGITYRDYFKFSELLRRAPSHRVLAVFRGENEGFLKASVQINSEKAYELLSGIFIKAANYSSDLVREAIRDCCKRLLFPSLETEIRQWAKEKADREAIGVFSSNLRQLLLAAPLGQKNVMAIDPGFRTGCKIVCLDRQGQLMYNETIYPHPPQNEVKESLHKIRSLVNAYKIEAIAIGNGTAGRETERLIRSIPFPENLVAVMVNESGASVYSASPVARKEFPDHDITVRGAVSIGRRLMDPLAELVKIDPKSIGVGQYQHDVNQADLHQSLEDTVVSCVNSVGVEVNTASEELLTYVSGVGPSLAGKVVEYRNRTGPFQSREDLKKVPRFGAKAFEQAAGFLRISDGSNPLDKSAVHPESYPVVEKFCRKLNCSITDLIGNEIRNKIDPEEFVSDTIGLPTLSDIIQELAKPGRDPRKKFEMFEFDKNIHSIHDLRKGMKLPGIVTNITNFGAFVDIGVHQDGLVHISQMTGKFIKDPNQVVRLNQKVMVEVTDVDPERKRIQLSMKGTEK